MMYLRTIRMHACTYIVLLLNLFGMSFPLAVQPMQLLIISYVVTDFNLFCTSYVSYLCLLCCLSKRTCIYVLFWFITGIDTDQFESDSDYKHSIIIMLARFAHVYNQECMYVLESRYN